MIKLLNKCATYQKWIFSSIKQPETFIKKNLINLSTPGTLKFLKKSQNSKKKRTETLQHEHGGASKAFATPRG